MHAELLIARVRACAEDGGPLEQAYLAHAEADYCRAVGSDEPDRWVAAAAAWEALGHPYPAAVARWRNAEALVAAGDREAAAAIASAAAETAERLGAAWLAGELESLAARARLRLGDGDGAARVEEDESEDPFGLTPRERQVLALVAAGRDQPRDRAPALHGREDSQRPRLPHPVQARRPLAHRGRRRRAQAGPRRGRLNLKGGLAPFRRARRGRRAAP